MYTADETRLQVNPEFRFESTKQASALQQISSVFCLPYNSQTLLGIAYLHRKGQKGKDSLDKLRQKNGKWSHSRH